MSEENKQKLAEARNNSRLNSNRSPKSLKNLAGDIAKEAGISNPASLIGFILPNDLFFFFAIMIALFKDISDFFLIGSIPLIGTIVTILASITLFFAMLISGASFKNFKNKKDNKKLAIKVGKKWGTLAAGTIFEMLFGLNFIPIETISALLIYFFILQERKIAYEA